MNPQNFTISLEQVQKLANYLVTRPWGEVNELINVLSKLPPAQDAAPEQTPAQNQ